MRKSSATLEVLATLTAVAVSVVLLYLTLDFPRLRGDPGGGALWPRIMAVALLGGCLILLWEHAVKWRAVVDELSAGARWGALRDALLGRTFLVIASAVVYPVGIIWIGFLIATLVFSTVLMVLLRAPWKSVLVFPLTLTAAVYALFVYFLGASVPHGIVFGMLGVW